MAAPTKRVTGWLNKLEFHKVYKDLYSDNEILNKHAVDKICVWRSRLDNRMSAALECTCELMQAKLQRKHVDNNDEVPRLSHSLAVVRFVNLMTEKSQTKQYAQALHGLATDLGLPEWLVDLRHDATHSSIPSYETLITGVDFALEWLKINYWEPQLMVVCPEDSSSFVNGESNDVKKELSHLLSLYMENAFQSLQYDHKAGGDVNYDAKDIETILNELQIKASVNRREIIELLLVKGYLIPTNAQIEALGMEVDVACLDKSIPIPNIFFEFWKPIINILFSLKYISFLIHQLADLIEERTNIEQRFIAGWMLVIFTSHYLSDTDTNINSMNNKTFFFKKEKILEQILDKPNKYTATLLNELYPLLKGVIDETQCKNLTELIECYTHVSSTNEQCEGTENVYSLPDILQEEHNIEEENVTENISEHVNEASNFTTYNKSYRGWQVADRKIPWHIYPIGYCPNFCDGSSDTLEI